MSSLTSTTARVLRNSIRAVPYARTQASRALTRLPGRIPGLAVPVVPAPRFMSAVAAEPVSPTSETETKRAKQLKINVLSIRVRGRDFSNEDLSSLKKAFQAEFNAIPADVKPTVEGVELYTPEQADAVPDIIQLHFQSPVFANEYYAKNMYKVVAAARKVLNEEQVSVVARRPHRLVVLRGLDVTNVVKEDKITNVLTLCQAIANDLVQSNPEWKSAVRPKMELISFVKFDDPETLKKVAVKFRVPDVVSWQDTLVEGLNLLGKRRIAYKFNKDYRPTLLRQQSA